ncbi:MAG: ETC complex I subunit [Beijerinckiaceae bacterium]|jgi:uncharacterized protein YjiK
MTARIFKPARAATQSGGTNSNSWRLTYEPEAALEVEPLMGWTSSGDMNRQITLSFATKEEAIAYAGRNGLAYRVEEPKPTVQKTFSYSDNFKSTRLGQWTH